MTTVTSSSHGHSSMTSDDDVTVYWLLNTEQPSFHSYWKTGKNHDRPRQSVDRQSRTFFPVQLWSLGAFCPVVLVIGDCHARQAAAVRQIRRRIMSQRLARWRCCDAGSRRLTSACMQWPGGVRCTVWEVVAPAAEVCGSSYFRRIAYLAEILSFAADTQPNGG